MRVRRNGVMPLIIRPVYNYRSCVRAGGIRGYIYEIGFCRINGSTYYPKLAPGEIN